MANYVLIDPNNPELAASYIQAGGNIYCNNGGVGVCYIVAGDNGLNQPIITQDILGSIIQGYVTGNDSNSVKLRS